MALRTKTSGRDQLREMGHDTGTFRYEDGVTAEHKQDLITKGEVDPLKSMLNELLPPAPASLDGEHLTIYATSTRKYSGFLAVDPVASYKSGNGAGVNVNYIVKDADFTLETPNPADAIGDGDAGVLEIYINNETTPIDSVDIGSLFDEGFRDSAQAYTPKVSDNGYISVVSVEKYNDFSAWQKVVARLNIKKTDLVVGYNFIILKHVGLESGDQASQLFDVFFDNATQSPSLGNVDIAIHSNTSPKFLSGVKYLGSNDAIKASTQCSHIAKNTYVSNPIQFSGLRGAPTLNLPIGDAAVSGLSTPPLIGEEMIVTDKVITLSVSGQCTKNARLTAKPSDPFGSYTAKQSPSQNLLISTFGLRSSNTKEYFDDERYRLPLNFDFDSKTAPVANVWSSDAVMANGNAQLYVITDNKHGLMYPEVDFSDGYLPANTADYSAFSGDQQYVRCFVSPDSKGSVELTLEGLSGGLQPLGSGDVNVEIKLPTQTGWMDALKDYDSEAGVSNDGDGCLGSLSYTGGNAVIGITFGGKVTFDANNRMYCRVTLRNKNRAIDSAHTNW